MRPSAVLDVDRPERSCCRLLCTAKGRVLLRYAAYTLSKRVVVIFAAIALHSSCTALIETEYVGQARSTQLANTFYAVVVTAFAMCVAGRLGRKSTGRFVFELLTEITSWAWIGVASAIHYHEESREEIAGLLTSLILSGALLVATPVWLLFIERTLRCSAASDGLRERLERFAADVAGNVFGYELGSKRGLVGSVCFLLFGEYDSSTYFVFPFLVLLTTYGVRFGHGRGTRARLCMEESAVGRMGLEVAFCALSVAIGFAWLSCWFSDPHDWFYYKDDDDWFAYYDDPYGACDTRGDLRSPPPATSRAPPPP